MTLLAHSLYTVGHWLYMIPQLEIENRLDARISGNINSRGDKITVWENFIITHDFRSDAPLANCIPVLIARLTMF